MAHLCLSLCSLLQSARQKPVLFCDGRSTTAAELHDQVALLSKTLTERLNTRPGDRIVLLGLNTDAFFTTLLSVLDAGAAACPLNWRWSAAELAAAISLLQPKALFVDDYCMPLALQACASLSAPNSGPPAPIVRMSPSPASDQLSQQQFTRTLSIQTLLLREQQAAAHQGTAPPQFSYSSPACAAPALEPQEQQQPLPPQLQLLHPSPRQPALVVFTSGTTGASKGVMLSHTNLTHQSLAKLAVVQYSAADTYLHMAPLFHIGGLSSAFAVLMAGGAHVLMPRYSPKTALQLIQQHIVTSLIAVPAMMQDLTAAAAAAAVSASDGQQHQQQQKQQQHQQQQKQQPQLPSLQRVLVGAGGMPLRLQRAVAALFPHAILQTAYGMTEASSSVTFVSVQEQQQLMAAATTAATAAAAAAADGAEGYGSSGRSVYAVGVCVGRPGPGIAVRIDLSALPSSSSSSSSSQHHQQHHCLQQQQLQQQGEEGAGPAAAKAGVVGEVCTRGPHVMLGYWRDAQATSKALSASGWLHTGDLGYLDPKGNLWLVGRLKDMIKSGGENVHAADVEGMLLTHPAIAAAAVFGLDHERLGEQVAAVVVLQPGWVWADAGSVLRIQQPVQQLQTQPPPQQLQQPHPQPSQQQQQHGRVVSAAGLQQHCRSAGLSPYKLPRVVVCTQQLPLNSSGKVLKLELKQQVQAMLTTGRSSGSSGLPEAGAGAGAGAVKLRSKL